VKNITISDASISLESEVKDSIYYEKKVSHPALNQAMLKKYIEVVRGKMNSMFTCFKCPLSINALAMNGTFDVYEKTLGEFSLSLSDFTPLKDAHLQFALASSFSRKFDGSFSLKGEGLLHRAVDGAIDKLDIDSVIISKNYANNTKKEFTLNLGAEQENNKICINFADNDGTRDIIAFVLERAAKSGNTNLSINAYLDNSILEYFLFGNKTDPWSVTLNGKAENVENKSDWVFKSYLDLNLSNAVLLSVVPGLNSPLKIQVTSALDFHEDNVELISFTTNVEDVAKQQLKCSCELQSPFKVPYDLNVMDETITKALRNICLDFNIERFCLDVANSVYPDVSLSGVGQGKFRFQVQDNGAFFSSNDNKLRLEGVDLEYCGQPVICNIDLETKLNCRVDNGLDAEFSEFSVLDKNLKSISLQGGCKITLKNDRNNLSGYFVGDLPTLLVQPLFKNSRKISTGVSSINFDVETTPDKILVGELGAKLKSVSFAGEKRSLDSEYNAKIARIGDSKGIKFDLSGNTHYLGSTELELHGTSTKNVDNGLKNVQASLHGTKLCISDLLALKDLFEVNRFEKKGYNFLKNRDLARKPNKMDEISVALSLGIDEVFWKTFRCLSNVTCDVKYETRGLYIPNFKCYAFEAPFSGSWTLNRNTGEYSDMYSANLSFQLSNLNASKCVHSLGYDPSSFTGQFNLEGNLESEQSSLSEIFSGLHGSIRLNGHSGNIRFSSFMSNTQKNLLGFAGIAGIAMGNKSAAIERLIGYANNLTYDTITASVVRGSDNNIVLDNFVIKNPDMKFLSRGKIFYNPDVDMKQYGLFVDSQIFTKGELTDLLQQLDLISGEVDYYGYSAGPHIAVHGTLGEPDLSELSALVKKVGNVMINDDQSLLNPKNLLQLFGK
ncbi:MAG: AsmA-like C-terminal region-containing protein, partial [Opitutales bacterium]|nr:AsmA-like C-terminal region-containing protein [Opitutales bacterium]